MNLPSEWTVIGSNLPANCYRLNLTSAWTVIVNFSVHCELLVVIRDCSIPFCLHSVKSCFFFKCNKENSLVGFEIGILLKYYIYYRCFGLNYLMASATSESFKWKINGIDILLHNCIALFVAHGWALKIHCSSFCKRGVFCPLRASW